MRLSGYKAPDRQARLWSPPLGNHGHIRFCLGNIVEEATAGLVGGRRHKTNSMADYCPDVSVGQVYYECKAAGRSNQTFVYAGRLAHDLEFAAAHELRYIIWHHRINTLAVADEEALRAAFFATLRGIYIVPFAGFYEIATARKLEKLNSQYGKAGGYGSGYRVNIKSLAAWRVG